MATSRRGEFPHKTIDRLCALLGCQPGDVLEYVPDDMRLPDQSNTGTTDDKQE